MTTDLTRHIEAIATFALGNPNPAHSTRSQWRYGTNGSVAVEMAGAKAGTWYDHELNEGGGPWELLAASLPIKTLCIGSRATSVSIWRGPPAVISLPSIPTATRTGSRCTRCAAWSPSA